MVLASFTGVRRRLRDVDQHILLGSLQLYQAMYLSFARVLDVENDELRVSVLFTCSSVRCSGNDELRVCLVFLLFRSAPKEFFCHESKQMAPEWMEAPFTTPHDTTKLLNGEAALELFLDRYGLFARYTLVACQCFFDTLHEYEAITTLSPMPGQAALLGRRVAAPPGRDCPGRYLR